jgi:hypothetical protein
VPKTGPHLQQITKTVLGCQKTNGINPTSAIRKQLNFPMTPARTAHNIILPPEKIRIRNTLLQSLQCKITSGCSFVVIAAELCDVNMKKGKHCPTIRHLL